MPVKIATDSVSDIPPEVAEELGITVIPVLVRFGEEVYRDGIEYWVSSATHFPEDHNNPTAIVA